MILRSLNINLEFLSDLNYDNKKLHIPLSCQAGKPTKPLPPQKKKKKKKKKKSTPLKHLLPPLHGVNNDPSLNISDPKTIYV